MHRGLTRRDWMRTAAGAGAALAAARVADARQGASGPVPQRPVFCLFSKHLPELAWGDVGRAVKDAGFDGVDLTVRAGGHVLPERAAEDLPRAIEAIGAHGVSVPMVTTDLTSAANPFARPLLTAAARAGVGYFKTGYWHYKSPDVREQAAATAEALAGLAVLARDCGMQLGFHNHAGYVGAALWDIAPAMDRLDPAWAGYYFDPRHAVADGGGGAWRAASWLVLPRLKMLALKDFVWTRTPKGWRIENCPLGEGIVDWAWMGSTIRTAQFGGPVSVHLEYEIPGSGTPGDGTRRTLEAAVRDLAVARRFFAGS
jgi:L-ribulose-5-phosphate 3-epimerase